MIQPSSELTERKGKKEMERRGGRKGKKVERKKKENSNELLDWKLREEEVV